MDNVVLEKWLNYHSQKAVISGMISTWRPVTTGISQGLTAGPILFDTFINDLREPQRDRKGLEKWTNRTLMKFNKVKCKTQTWRLISWRTALRKRPSGCSGGNKLNMSQPRLCGKESQQPPGLHQTDHHQQVREGSPSPVVSTGQTTHVVLHPVLRSPVEE